MVEPGSLVVLLTVSPIGSSREPRRRCVRPSTGNQPTNTSPHHTHAIRPAGGSAKLPHYGTDNVLRRELHSGEARSSARLAPGEYIRVFYIAHANSGCLLEYQPDLLASQQPNFSMDAGSARTSPRSLIAPGSWMSSGRATCWRSKAC